VRLAARDKSLTVEWRATLRDESNYVRQTLLLKAADWVECGDRRGAAGFAIDRRADDERVDVVTGERLERVATVAGLGYDGDIAIVFEHPSKSTSDEGRALDQHHTESHTRGGVSVCDVRLRRKVAGGVGA